MISLVQGFLEWFFNLPFISPILQYIGDNVVGATSNAVKNYAIMGVEDFWPTWLAVAVLLTAAVWGIIIFVKRKKQAKTPATESSATVNSEDEKNAKNKKSVGGVLKGAVTFVLAFIVFVAGCSIQQAIVTLGVFKEANAEEYAPEAQTLKEDSPLKGKTILFVGSSVVEGAAALRDGPAEYLQAVDGIIPIKSSVSGTTIAYQDERSYAPRLMSYGADVPVDAVVLQLSTNDAGQGTDLGTISDSYDPADFDKNTFTGSMELMLEYCKRTWDCPVIVFTITSYGGRYETRQEDPYDGLVQLTKEICDKWDAYLLNMWEDEELNDITQEQFDDWMANGAHPCRRGYLEWWLPEFEEALYQFFE